MSHSYSIKRQHPRYNVDIKVSVRVASESFDARTRDISRAGVCLVADKPIDREAEIELELVLTFGDDGVSEPLPVRGKVAWCTALFGAFQIGVKFVKVDEDQGRYLDMFIGFLDGTLAPGELFPEDKESSRGLDPEDPFV
jgi:hypothetical protein